MKSFVRVARASSTRSIASALSSLSVVLAVAAQSLTGFISPASATTSHDSAAFEQLWSHARILKPQVLSWLPGDPCCPIVSLPDSSGLDCATPAEWAVIFSTRSTPPELSFDSMPDAIGVESRFTAGNRDCGTAYQAEVRQLRLVSGFYDAFQKRWTGQIARRAHAKELADSLALAWKTYRAMATSLHDGLYRGNGYIRLDSSEYDMATQSFRIPIRSVPLDLPYKVLAQALYAPFQGHYKMPEGAPAGPALDLASETFVVPARTDIADEVMKRGGGNSDGIRVDFVYRFSSLVGAGEATQWSPGYGQDESRTILVPAVEVLAYRMQVATPDGPKTATIVSGLAALEGLGRGEHKRLKGAAAGAAATPEPPQADLCQLGAVSLVDTARVRREVGAWADECAEGYMILAGADDVNVHLWRFTPFPEGFLGDPQVGSYKSGGCRTKLGLQSVSDREIRFHSYDLEGGGCVGISYFSLIRQGSQLVLNVFSDEERTQLEKAIPVIAVRTGVTSKEPAAPVAANSPAPAQADQSNGPPPAPANEVTLPSGLKYADLKVGRGESVKQGVEVAVLYSQWINGRKVTGDRGFPFTFRVGSGAISGLSEGVTGMKAGGRRLLTVPPSLGYGAAGNPPAIPPNATMTFDVELVRINH